MEKEIECVGPLKIYLSKDYLILNVGKVRNAGSSASAKFYPDQIIFTRKIY